MLRRLESKYGCEILSDEENRRIAKEINEKMEKTRHEYNRMNFQSIRDAQETIIYC